MDLVRKDTERIYKGVVKHIQNLLKEGTLAPGDQLLSERQLSVKLGVSRTTLREALAALEILGVIEMSPGGGARIKKVNVAEVVESLASFIVREKESIDHLLEVRSLLEVGIAELAAIRATETNITNIKNCLSQLERDILERNSTDESDPKFHFAIVEATHNPLLVEIMEVIIGLMKEQFSLTRASMLRQQPQLLLSNHRCLALAIEKHDWALAMRTARQVIAMALEERISSDMSDDEMEQQGFLTTKA